MSIMEMILGGICISIISGCIGSYITSWKAPNKETLELRLNNIEGKVDKIIIALKNTGVAII